jgi:hypothetical protein
VCAVLMMRIIKEYHPAAGERHQVAAVRLLEHLTVEHELRSPMHHHAP